LYDVELYAVAARLWSRIQILSEQAVLIGMGVYTLHSLNRNMPVSVPHACAALRDE